MCHSYCGGLVNIPLKKSKSPHIATSTKSMSKTACMILAQYKNNVQIVIFREMPWDITSFFDKNKLPLSFKIRMCIAIGSPS